MRVQITKSGVYDPNGILLPVGSIQVSIGSLPIALLKSWCQSGLALDLDGRFLELATVTDNNPPTTMTDYNPYGYGALTTTVQINTPAGGTLNSLNAESRGVAPAYSTVQIVNISATNSLSIAHQGTTAYPTYGSSFQCMGGAAVTLLPFAGAYAVRNSTNTYWTFR